MRSLTCFANRCRALWNDREAVAAVEFAAVFPIALIAYLGAALVSDSVMAARQLSNVTRTVVDLASRQPTSSQATSTPTPSNAVSSSTLSSIMTGAQSLMYPHSTGTLKLTLSAIDVTNNSQNVCCSVLVRWSFSQGGTLRPCSSQITGTTSSRPSSTQVPSELLPVGIHLAQPLAYLIADASYVYQPAVTTSLLNFAPSMQRSQYMMPRSIGQVITGTLTTSGNQSGQVCY